MSDTDTTRDTLREVMAEFRGNEGGADATPAPEPADVSASVAPSAGDDATGGGESSVSPPRSDGGRDSQTPAGGRGDSQRTRDASGKFAKADKSATPAPTKADPKAPTVTPAPKPAEAAPSATPPPAPGETSVALKAPQSWKPAAREAWGKLPPAVQAEVDRREKEMQAGLREAAEKAKRGDVFQQAVAPFESMLAAEGVPAPQVVRNLLQTAHSLRYAPNHHKGTIIATLMQNFGVPEEEVAAAIQRTGQAAPQAQPQTGQYRDPRVDQLLAQIQQRDSQRQQAHTQEWRTKVQSFGESHEFFEDVRDSMADAVERQKRQGLAPDLEAAYDEACWANREVRSILQQREAAKAATSSQEATQRARAAASSIKSQPAGVSMNGAHDLDTRDILREELQKARRR